MIIGQSCDSKKCKLMFNVEIIKNFCEAITTPHEINFSTNKIKCLYCGKISKIKN